MHRCRRRRSAVVAAKVLGPRPRCGKEAGVHFDPRMVAKRDHVRVVVSRDGRVWLRIKTRRRPLRRRVFSGTVVRA